MSSSGALVRALRLSSSLSSAIALSLAFAALAGCGKKKEAPIEVAPPRGAASTDELSIGLGQARGLAEGLAKGQSTRTLADNLYDAGFLASAAPPVKSWTAVVYDAGDPRIGPGAPDSALPDGGAFYVRDRRRAPEFEDWLERMGIADFNGQLLPQGPHQALLALASTLQGAA